MSRFKTELCNNLIELGICKYGERCHYAHGAHELRQVSKRHPKYRTEKCKNFELTGKCPFGPRCSYVHPKPDLDSMIDQLTRYMKHTRAPKPDSEDDDMKIVVNDDNLSLPFTRTNTNTSLSISSTCESLTTSSDENKENLLTLDYQVLKNNQIDSKSAYTIDNPFAFNEAFCQTRNAENQTSFTFNNVSSQASTLSQNNSLLSNTNTITRTPLSSNTSNNILTSINNTSNNLHNFNSLQQHISYNGDEQLKVQNSTGAFSNNSSLIESKSHESNKKLQLTTSNSSNYSDIQKNPIGFNSPLSDFLLSPDISSKGTIQPKKQFFTRF